MTDAQRGRVTACDGCMQRERAWDRAHTDVEECPFLLLVVREGPPAVVLPCSRRCGTGGDAPLGGTASVTVVHCGTARLYALHVLLLPACW